jgi:hypothetical protein
MEEWRPISDIPGYEEFTNFVLNIAGELRNIKTRNTLTWSYCNDYLICQLNQKPATPKMIQQHRAICCLFKPNPRNLPEIDHINRNRSDNRIDNLQWASRLEQQHNQGIHINNTSGEQNIQPAFNHGKPIWRIVMRCPPCMCKGKEWSKTFPRDVTSNEVPQEVINFRNKMRLQIQTELRNLIS